MATTRLMPLHTDKGRTVGQAISDIIDYTENPQKTDGGRLITSWQCDSRIAADLNNGRGRQHLVCCHPLNYRTAKTGRAVKGGAFAPFILTVDGLGRVCYFYLSSIVDGVTE